MSVPFNDHQAEEQAGTSADRTGYPENHVVAVLDTKEQVNAAVEALTSGGFMESEAQYGTGPAAADELHASTGHTGLAALLVRLAQRIGVADEEMEMKNRYEQAMRDNRFVISVAAPTEERKNLVARLLEEHGGHFVNFLGSSTIESMVRRAPAP